MTNEQLQLLSEWYELKQQLDTIKAKEMEVRKQVSSIFTIGVNEEGSETIDFAEGYKVKKTQKFNFTCDPIERIEEVLSQIDFEKYPGVSGVFRFKPELSITIYRTLPDEVKSLVDSVITVKVAAPTIEIIPPKGKK